MRKEQNIPNYTKTPSTSDGLFITPPKNKTDRDKSKIKQRICILKLTMKKEIIYLTYASSSIHLKTQKHQHIKTNQRWFWKIHEDESKTCMLERLKHKHIGASDLPFWFTSAASDAVVTRLREPPIEREVGVFLGRWQPPMERSLFPFIADTHR